ncbi:MAG: protein-L-isoaspartate(D-aspartate) O-methyltransferase [Candidatus Bathyarchaeia archaeon]
MISKGGFAESRRRLVDALIREGILRDEKVIDALLKVPRELFVPSEYKGYAYADTPLPIGYGGTISAPHMVAMMDEALELEGGLKVLEVGAGSGYHAATIAHIVSRGSVEGHVFTVEIVPELFRLAVRNLMGSSYSRWVTVILGDGSKGFHEAAPYDRILVTAAAPDIPKPLVEQLGNPGVLVIPVGGQYSFQSLTVVRKYPSGRIKIEERGGCSFIPLMGEYGFGG